MNTLGEKISSIRKSKGFSQEKLAEEANINLRTLQRIEKGKTSPHGDTLTRICEALGISVEEVANNEKNKSLYYLKILVYVCIILAAGVVIYSQIEWGGDKNATLVTKRIQYDVPIATHENEYYWWLENMEVSDRMTFITNLFDKAMAGKVNTCDMSLNPVGPEEIKALYTDTMFLTLMKPQPPYNLVDTFTTRFIEPAEIGILRFQEEWRYNDEDLIMEKRVLGICLVKSIEVQGRLVDQPLFWIYFDDALLNEKVAHPAF